jgi:uncharacterized protein
MQRKFLAILAFAFLFLSVLAQATLFPARKGMVSDYSDKLDQTQIEELSSLIRQYEQQTSIEFAVVIVNSLDGKTAREYAEGIGDTWGVGKAGRNNGVVLLWAPSERAYSLRIADGLSADLGDEDAKRITQENLVPYFKRGEYYAGLKETLRAAMQKLGNETWEERLRARSEATRARSEGRTSTALMAVLIGAIVGLGAVLGVLLYRSRQGKEKLAEMADAQNLLADNLGIAESNAPQAQQLLHDLTAEMPEQDTRSLSEDLAAQRARIANIRNDAARLDFTDLTAYDEVLRIKDGAATEAGLLGSVRQRIGDIRRAKERSRALMQQLASEKFEISGVRDSSRRGEVDDLLSGSRAMYDQACQRSSMSMFDWLLINDMLNSSQDHVRKAEEASQAESYVPVTTTPSFDTSSTSFGGDTGGSFGGGGGFSGGSGSDGSY